MKRFSKITTTQLARICGVSQGTVDRALHNRGGIHPKTKEKILAVAREYDYVPSVRADEESVGSMLIGVVLYDLYNEFFSKLAMSLVSTAKSMGYSVIFLFSDKDIAAEKSAIEYFNYIGVDGIVLFSVGSDDEEYFRYLHSLMKPIAVVGNRVSDLTYIGIDDRCAMYDLTRRLLQDASEGEITYFAPILKKALNRDNAQLLRLEGFKEAMKEARRPFRIVTEDGDLTGDCAGILCATDHYVLRVLNRFGTDTKMQIAGFDNTSFLKHMKTKLLTVDYSTDRIAQECLGYILGSKYNKNIPHTVVYNNQNP